mmetsp:Transcript_23187/g.34012  ORF Transcript_23187/g.34012 Transcript_23187/m.34012 type:complete len:145 (-) Transcript_23187:590-1024(-)
MALWGRVLAAVPHSRLLLKSPVFEKGTLKEHVEGIIRQLAPDNQKLQAEMESEGRVILLGRTVTESEHLRSYLRMDVALDTFPYSGTTTTIECLLMGVPVVTKRQTGAKSVHASNVSASILMQAGLRELVGNSDDDFVKYSKAE